MSDDERAWVWNHSPYAGRAQVIHLKMADWANEGHGWMLYCGDATLAKAARCSRRSVERAKTQMIEDGFLEDLHERHANGNLLYRFLMPGTTQCDKLSGTPNATNCPTNTTVCQTNATNTGSAPLPITKREPEEPQGRVMSSFDAFYAAYPHKMVRSDALKAFKRVQGSAPAIMAGLSRWISYWRAAKTPTDKIPYPATWLNRHQWEDAPAPVSAVSRSVSRDEQNNLFIDQAMEALRSNRG
jgi:hypothetical protein